MMKKDSASARQNGRKQARRGFLGNGLSRTAMVFKIATLAGHELTPVELNRIKYINPPRAGASVRLRIGGGK